MGRIWVPQTRQKKVASANPPACAPCTLLGEAQHQDLGAPLPYQWRERAKLLESRMAAAAAHVGCCVLCHVVCCYLSELSYHPGSNTISANPKWPLFARSYHKIGQQTPQITGCANWSSFRDVALILTFWWKSCLGHAMSVQKNC
jgi:hypothetical protein